MKNYIRQIPFFLCGDHTLKAHVNLFPMWVDGFVLISLRGPPFSMLSRH